MIIDAIENWRQYALNDPQLRPGFEFITATFNDTMEDGRYDLPGDAGYVNVESYDTSPADERKFEAHRKHIDIQYVLAGEEIIQWAPVPELAVVEAYSEDRDAGFYRNTGSATGLFLPPRRFAVFYPSDAHKPGCSIAGPVRVRKIIAKIRL